MRFNGVIDKNVKEDISARSFLLKKKKKKKLNMKYRFFKLNINPIFNSN